MNVGQLRELLKGVDDTVGIFEIFEDHEARIVSLELGKVCSDPIYNYFGQYFGEEHLVDGTVSIPAIIVT